MVLGLGSWEIVLVGLALLILFGPEHAPQAVRTLGRWQARIRSTLQQIERTIEEETEDVEEEVGSSPFRPSQPPPEAETWQITEPGPQAGPDVEQAGRDEADAERDGD